MEGLIMNNFLFGFGWSVFLYLTVHSLFYIVRQSLKTK